MDEFRIIFFCRRTQDRVARCCCDVGLQLCDRRQWVHTVTAVLERGLGCRNVDSGPFHPSLSASSLFVQTRFARCSDLGFMLFLISTGRIVLLVIVRCCALSSVSKPFGIEFCGIKERYDVVGQGTST